MQSKPYPLQDIEIFLDERSILNWIPKIENGYFDQYLMFEDYVGEQIRLALYPLVEQSFASFWNEVVESYWDTDTNAKRAWFYGHRMLVIMERVNVSYLLYPYFELIKAIFLDFELRAKHHLACDLELSKRIGANGDFRLLAEDRKFKYDVAPINDLAPLIRLEKPRAVIQQSHLPPKYDIAIEPVLDRHLAFLNPTKSTLTPIEFQELRLILHEVLKTGIQTTTDKRFKQVITGDIQKKHIKIEFAQLLSTLLPGSRARWFTDSIALLFGFNKRTLYSHWPMVEKRDQGI